MNLKANKTVLIIGASGSIGMAIAYLLAKEGYSLCLHYFSNVEVVTSLQNDLKSKGCNVMTVQADIADAQQVSDMFNKVDSSLGPIVGLVNAAGIDGGRHSAYELNISVMEKVFAINFYGVVNCINEALPRMLSRHGGSIVNLSSQAAIYGGIHLAHYAASKGALNSYTVGIAKEVIKDNVRINIVSPGPVEDVLNEKHVVNPISLPIGRLAKSEEVAEAVAWLLSDKASYVSGATIPVTAAR
jgi:NAD(P)-dependent dehydrogenase (short-subunit alcohol dehydrogenase family)